MPSVSRKSSLASDKQARVVLNQKAKGMGLELMHTTT